MSFLIALMPGELDVARDQEFEGDPIDVLRCLGASGAQFVVVGFGRAAWPLSVEYDLSLAIAPMLEAVSAVEAGEEFQIDFWGQGVERSLGLIPRDDEMTDVSVSSWGSWAPKNQVESLPTVALTWMLRSLLLDVKTAGEMLGLDSAWMDVYDAG